MKQLRHVRVGLVATVALAALLVPYVAAASPPSFTGSALHALVAPAGPVAVNLRFQGAIAGTPSMRVAVVGIAPAGVGLAAAVFPASGGVCLQITNGQGIDFTQFQASVTVNVSNSEAPNGVQGTIQILTGQVADDTSAATCADPHNPPTANAGSNQTVPATGPNGALVTLDGSASSDPNPGGTIVSYVWTDATTNQQLATGVTAPVQLSVGVHSIRLTVTDNSTDPATNTAAATVSITVTPVHLPPIANAGSNRSVQATLPSGSLVTLDGSASSDPNPGGTIVSYVWTDATTNQQLATGVTAPVQLSVGVHSIRLTVTDNSPDPRTNTASTTVTITVLAPASPIANAGPASRTVPDTDGLPGEWVLLDGSASTTPSGTITSYSWYDGSEKLLGTGSQLRTRLPDGADTIMLVVTDSRGLSGSATVVITVGAGRRATLGTLPGLTPNQKSTAQALDSLCLRLAEANAVSATPTLPADQADLLARCNGILLDPSQQHQVGAVAALGAQDLDAMRAQALVFSNSQYLGVLDRMTALRGGARGLNLADLSIDVGGKPVSLGTLADVATHVLGGGASADTTTPGGLLSDKLGVWLRGNYAKGDQGTTEADAGFNGHQTTVTLGVDYRLTDKLVLGGALGHARSSVAFGSSAGGGLETVAWIGTLYAAAFVAQNFYLDAVLNYGRSDYDTTRHIVYQEGGLTVDRTAQGTTSGPTVSGGVNFGYDFALGGLTITPIGGYFYQRARIDGFGEDGAGGLNLAYGDQTYRSSTASLGMQFNYAVNLPFGVLLPHARAEYLHDFEDNAALLNVHFAADPGAGTTTPPIVLRGDIPNRSYWRVAGGTSLQFKHGVSAYVEYQQLANYGALRYHDLAVGLRAQQLF